MRLLEEVFRHRTKVCAESWPQEENPLPHKGIEPASAAWQSDALTNWAPPMQSWYLTRQRAKRRRWRRRKKKNEKKNEWMYQSINKWTNEFKTSSTSALCPIFHCFRLQDIALCTAVNNLTCIAVNNLASIIWTVNYSKRAGAHSRFNQGKLTKRNFSSRLDDRQALGWHIVT